MRETENCCTILAENERSLRTPRSVATVNILIANAFVFRSQETRISRILRICRLGIPLTSRIRFAGCIAASNVLGCRQFSIRCEPEKGPPYTSKDTWTRLGVNITIARCVWVYDWSLAFSLTQTSAFHLLSYLLFFENSVFRTKGRHPGSEEICRALHFSH